LITLPLRFILLTPHCFTPHDYFAYAAIIAVTRHAEAIIATYAISAAMFATYASALPLLLSPLHTLLLSAAAATPPAYFR